MVSLADLQRMALKKFTAATRTNAQQTLVALDAYGVQFGLDQPHRLAQYLAQLFHESGEFRYDQEIASGAAYEGRKDLGNTKKGDGKRFKGRTALQVTGRANYRAFTTWCRKNIRADAPDFEAQPEPINTDPWEGVGPLWYWSTRKLNAYADQGNVETITRKINGGLNGFDDRVMYLARCSLVLLGYGPTEMKKFQTDKKLKVVDGVPGPVTRAALHGALLKLTPGANEARSTAIAPIVDVQKVTKIVETEKAVAVVPAAIDKPILQTGGFWERISQGVFALVAGIATTTGLDWRLIVALAVGGVAVAGIGIWRLDAILSAVKRIRTEVAA